MLPVAGRVAPAYHRSGSTRLPRGTRVKVIEATLRRFPSTFERVRPRKRRDSGHGGDYVQSKHRGRFSGNSAYVRNARLAANRDAPMTLVRTRDNDCDGEIDG